MQNEYAMEYMHKGKGSEEHKPFSNYRPCINVEIYLVQSELIMGLVVRQPDFVECEQQRHIQYNGTLQSHPFAYL